MQKLPTLLLGTGLLFLVASVLLGWLIIPDLIQDKIEQQVRLQNGSETWKKWQDIPVPIYISFYIFNVTNPSEVEKGEKPILTELGPYVYEEKRYKIDLSIDEQADTVTYRQPIIYYFRSDKSNGTENDNITLINIPLIGLSAKARTSATAVEVVMEMYRIRFREPLFVKCQVREILFEGYKQDMIHQIQHTTGMKILPNGTFGLYYGKNGSDDGLYEVYSGISDSSRFGKIRKRNGEAELSWWGEGQGEGAAYCNMINGSDGSVFPPFATKDRVLRLFNADLCRSLYLTFNQEVDYKGVTGYRFTVPETMLQDSAINPDNLCFCPKPSEGCPKSGVMPLSVCRKGAPIVASTPHFLDGDIMYADQAGLSPNRSKHETYIEIEPNTGLLLQAAKRIQVNVDLRRSSIIAPLKKVPEMIFPVLWAEEYVSADEKSIEKLKGKLLRPLKYIEAGKWTGLAISCFLIAAGICVFHLRCRRKREFI